MTLWPVLIEVALWLRWKRKGYSSGPVQPVPAVKFSVEVTTGVVVPLLITASMEMFLLAIRRVPPVQTPKIVVLVTPLLAVGRL